MTKREFDAMAVLESGDWPARAEQAEGEAA
jgi:hypothetical protein